MKELRGKLAVVTGGGNGIGRAVVRALAAAGTSVAVADLDREAAEAAAADAAAAGVASWGAGVDVRDRDSVEAFAAEVQDRLGEVRILHNNAGVGLIEPVATTTPEDWRWVMDVNYFGMLNTIGAFLPAMLELSGDRHIVNTGSISGLHTNRQLAGYNASKFAVGALTEVMHDELGPLGIGVSLLCPGMVGTGIMGRSRRLRSQQSRPAAPLPRAEHGDWESVTIQTPEAVADLVLWGIRNDELFLVTNPDARAIVADRFVRILAAFDRATPVIPAD